MIGVERDHRKSTCRKHAVCLLDLFSVFLHAASHLCIPAMGSIDSWLCRVHCSVLRACFTLLNFRSCASNVSTAWLGFPVNWRLAFGPSRIMVTKDSKAWGTDPFWLLWVTDPVAEDDSLNISSRTMLAVRSRYKALSSFSPGKAREISDPMSSSNASKTSLP